jgi:hypothetical protein
MLKMHQIDIKITFLNGDLDNAVYIEQSKGLLLKGNKIKSVSLSSYYIIWNKLINNDMKK